MRPRLLDLFCGAGGAAMGYHRAGFEISVDLDQVRDAIADLFALAETDDKEES